MANADVVCVDGVNGVEESLSANRERRGLSAVNASAFLSCDGSNK